MLAPKEVEGAQFKYQKVFGEDQFIAGGVVYIPVGGDKPGKFSKDNAYVSKLYPSHSSAEVQQIFYVIQGAVQVTVHRTSFIMAPGGSFLVPRGSFFDDIIIEHLRVIIIDCLHRRQ